MGGPRGLLGTENEGLIEGNGTAQFHLSFETIANQEGGNFAHAELRLCDAQLCSNFWQIAVFLNDARLCKYSMCKIQCAKYPPPHRLTHTCPHVASNPFRRRSTFPECVSKHSEGLTTPLAEQIVSAELLWRAKVVVPRGDGSEA